jgi:hypothetical protein
MDDVIKDCAEKIYFKVSNPNYIANSIRRRDNAESYIHFGYH